MTLPTKIPSKASHPESITTAQNRPTVCNPKSRKQTLGQDTVQFDDSNPSVYAFWALGRPLQRGQIVCDFVSQDLEETVPTNLQIRPILLREDVAVLGVAVPDHLQARELHSMSPSQKGVAGPRCQGQKNGVQLDPPRTKGDPHNLLKAQDSTILAIPLSFPEGGHARNPMATDFLDDCWGSSVLRSNCIFSEHHDMDK